MVTSWNFDYEKMAKIEIKMVKVGGKLVQN